MIEGLITDHLMGHLEINNLVSDNIYLNKKCLLSISEYYEELESATNETGSVGSAYSDCERAFSRVLKR